MKSFDLNKQLSIATVVEHYIPLTQSGGYKIGFCPIEKHFCKQFPNRLAKAFAVSKTQNTWYCFGCRIGGDIVSFIMHMEHCLKREAEEILTERYI